VTRPDANKFLYILNQIDTTAREDNPEDVVSAWQRALAQAGLTAGRFYRLYTPEVAIPIADETLRARFKARRDADMGEIEARMQQVEVDRTYRVLAVLEQAAHDFTARLIPKLQALRAQWRRRVLWSDGLLGALILAAGIAWTLWHQDASWLGIFGEPVWGWVALGVVGLLAAYTHFAVRRLAARHVVNTLRREAHTLREREFLDHFIRAFRTNTRFWHSVFRTRPVGWTKRSRQRLTEVLSDVHRDVQTLNDTFTNPSGTATPPAVATPETAPRLEQVNA
jgi:hypothetical protein